MCVALPAHSDDASQVLLIRTVHPAVATLPVLPLDLMTSPAVTSKHDFDDDQALRRCTAECVQHVQRAIASTF